MRSSVALLWFRFSTGKSGQKCPKLGCDENLGGRTSRFGGTLRGCTPPKDWRRKNRLATHVIVLSNTKQGVL